jgi:GDPmannose 4,6-dehydratase
MVRGQNNPRAALIEQDHPYVELVAGDLLDLPSLVGALERCQPDEVYNLAAVSFVGLSFTQAELTASVTGLGVLRMLQAIRMVGGRQANPIRFYQASSSEMFGRVAQVPQDESTSFRPASPYGCAKVFGHDITVNHRESYGMFACSGILFNHEGPRRGLEFVTRRITNAVARIALGLQDELVLADLEPRRDWGFAGDYVEAMWAMLQQDEPADYVVATGVAHSVRDFVELAFHAAGFEPGAWVDHVRCDPRQRRPCEVDLLVGDASKAARVLGWRPTIDFDALVRMMVEHDLALEGRRRSA